MMMLETSSIGRSKRPVILAYGVVVLSVAFATTMLALMQAQWRTGAHVSLFLLAIIISTRLGGIRSGLLAIALSVLAFAYFLPPVPSLAVETAQLPRLALFAIVALYFTWVVSAEKRAAESLRRARDELQQNVEALRAENIERKRTEEELRTSEAKFRALSENAPAAIFIYRGDRFCYANPMAEVITGYSPEEFCEMNFWDMAKPDSRDLVRRRGLALQRGELVPLRYELKIATKTGEDRWLDFTEGTFEFEGKPAVMGIAFDITERKRAENALRKSERLLREAEELGRTGSWEHDLVTGEIFNTEANLRLFFGDDRSKGARFEDYVEAVHPDDRPFVMERHAQLLAEAGPRDIEFRVVWPDGGVHVLFGRATVVRDESGKAVRVYGTNLDITERKRTEEALRENQQLLQLVLATMPVGVAVTDRAGDIVLANAASRRIWGNMLIVSGRERWARSKGFWHDSGKRIAPTDWASVRALSEGQISLNELIDIEAYDGEPKTIQNSSAPVRNADGLIVGAVVVNEDVTERVRAEEALRQSADRLQHLSRRLLEVQEEERRHLARELHDEFGQILATITLHLHVARRVAGAAAQSTLDECMALLQRAGEQVRSLALELRPAILETAGLDATLRWLAEQHTQQTGIATQVVGHLNGVSGAVAIAFFRVTQEALTNAVRHARARHVWIELSRSDSILELVIRDDGVGFDVASALEQAAARGHLGLLGMRERVQILGGSLEVDSGPGRGTRLRVAFPLVEHAADLERSIG